MSSSRVKLEEYLIPLEEILLATRNFSSETMIGGGRTGTTYKVQLSNRRAAVKRFYPGVEYFGQPEFLNLVDLLSRFNHKNIIRFIGYCDEANEKIIVSEYANNQSLSEYLYRPDENRSLTWAQRLKICLGAAAGLEYLHSGLGEGRSLIHRNIEPGNILLDENLEAKIISFDLSILVNQNQPAVESELAVVLKFYSDPLHKEGGIVTIESDICSFGVVLFEVLSGMMAYEGRSVGDNHKQTLISLVRRYYETGMDNLIDPYIRDNINTRSFGVFKKIAYQCISWNINHRPTINTIKKRIQEALDIQKQEGASAITTRSTQHHNLEKFRISLKEINMAIKDFSLETPIGDGGYGKFYQAKLSEHWQNSIVAIKCLDPKGHQGEKKFLNKVKLISSFHHRNIISFVGYCNEDNQMIIVSKYAVNGSLDHHLQNPNKRILLRWAQCLKICLGTAKGLDYLHSGLGKDNMVIHRDIKSGNILLDENMEAKICDFGLSKQGSINQQDTKGYTKVAVTNFYLDPLYRETDKLGKESDVYSFGVVLFEMLRGMMAYQYSRSEDGNPQHLISLVRRYYKDEPHKLIDPVIRDEIDNYCFHKFRELANRCISLNSEERPTMDTIINRIEEQCCLKNMKCKKIKT